MYPVNSSTISSLLSSDEIDEDLDYYLEWGKKNLSPTAYVAYAAHMRKVSYDLRSLASSINSLNLGADEAAFTIQKSRDLLRQAAETFTNQVIPFAKNIAHVERERKDVDNAIDAMTTELSNFVVQEQWRDHKPIPGFRTYKPETSLPRLAEYFMCEKAFESKISDSPNPTRDRAVVLATNFAIAEVLIQATPAGFPAFVAVASSQMLADMARAAEPALDSCMHDKDVEYWLNRQYELCGEGASFAGSRELARALLKIAQVPSDTLYALRDYMASHAITLCDTLGLTEKNLASVSIRALEMLAQHSPEAQEEKMWQMAAAQAARK